MVSRGLPSEHSCLPVWRFPNTVVSLYGMFKLFPGASQSEVVSIFGSWRAKWSDQDLEEEVKINNVFDMFFQWFWMALRDVVSGLLKHGFPRTHKPMNT